MSTPHAPAGFRLQGWHVLAMVVGFFALVVGVDVGFAVLAVRTFPGQVSVTPYEDGLVHNRRLARLAAQEKLGWRAAAAAEAEGVVVMLRDAGDRPLSGLTMTGRLERPATEAGRIALAFREAEPGRYVARHPALSGAWDLTAIAGDPAGHSFEAQRRLSWP